MVRRRGLQVIAGGVLLLAGCSGVPHDRSYNYGAQMMDQVVESTPGTGDPKADCRQALAKSPGNFAGYDASHALAGCLDEWKRVNR